MLTRTPSKSTSDQRRAHTSPRRRPFKLTLNEFLHKHVFPAVERKLGRALNGAEREQMRTSVKPWFEHEMMKHE